MRLVFGEMVSTLFTGKDRNSFGEKATEEDLSAAPWLCAGHNGAAAPATHNERAARSISNRLIANQSVDFVPPRSGDLED